VALLLSKGCWRDAVDGAGEDSALHLAARAARGGGVGPLAAVRALLSAGAKVGGEGPQVSHDFGMIVMNEL
jgi:hypothetical protein